MMVRENFIALSRTTIWICTSLLCPLAWSAESAPLSPEREQDSFHLADNNLRIDLVAAEPDLVSPVAIAWDAVGRLFVAEMSDYPTSPEKGRIRLLEDRDGDGRYERSQVFADQLPFPNGVLPWKDGVLVTAAPHIWYLVDTNADGVADRREILLTGFAEGNQQLRVNGLLWGLDNWIYGANGRSEGDVRWGDAGRKEDRSISIRGYDFRFRPEERLFETIAGRSQFGLGQDDWGNRFLSWNTIPIRHEVIPLRFLDRNPFLNSPEALADLLEPGDDGRVFPLTAPPLTFNQESTTHFNALCGLTIYRGDALGGAYAGNAFVGESLRNLVHRRVLDPAGATFLARRAQQEVGREFLASTDPWFHPVNFANSPDGGLYVVDFYRRFVEHPDYVHPSNLRGQFPWRVGAEHGRLWRIQRKDFQAGRKFTLDLKRASTAQLVELLSNANAWWRDTAQRLLVERADRGAVSLLENRVREAPRAQTRLQSLFVLSALDDLDGSVLKDALQDSHFMVRAAAVRLGASLLANKQGTSGLLLHSNLLGLAGREIDSRVRLELALAGGEFASPQREALLAGVAAGAPTDRWLALAVRSSLGRSPVRFLAHLAQAQVSWFNAPSVDQARFLETIAQLVGANRTPRELEECINQIQASPAPHPHAQISMLAGLADGLKRSGTSFRQILEEPPAELRKQFQAIAPRLKDFVGIAQDESVDSVIRLTAVKLLLHANDESAPRALVRLLGPDQPAAIQAGAVRLYGELSETNAAEAVFGAWIHFSKETRRRIGAASAQTANRAGDLIAAIERGVVASAELDLSTRQALSRIANDEIKQRWAQLEKGLADPDRERVVSRFTPALALEGKEAAGGALFARLCTGCHVFQGVGSPIGPDLSGLSSRPAESILVDVLDPSRQVAPDYAQYVLINDREESLAGLVVQESAVGVTLRRQSQSDETILRREIRELRATGKSFMPDGLEEGLTVSDMADLLAFLRRAGGGSPK